MYTLQDIKDEYYMLVARELHARVGLEEYIKENYVQTYDIDLNFIGYEKE